MLVQTSRIFSKVCLLKRLCRGFRKADVLNAESLGKQRGDLFVPETGDAAAMHAGKVASKNKHLIGLLS